MAATPSRLAAVLLLGLALLAGLPASAAQAAEDKGPLITIEIPPLYGLPVPYFGTPGEHLHLKLREGETLPSGPPAVYACLPVAPPAYDIAVPIHLIWKPDGFSAIFPPDADTSITDITKWVTPGAMFLPLWRDQLGHYELEVICAEAGEAGFKLGTASTAYSVEPEPYRTYVEADGPVSFWRLGDLPKGSRTLADSAGDHDGTYFADGGVHPALDRDGAPSCNVPARATSGCNDGWMTGITSEVRSDDDRAAFFTGGQYAAVQDVAAITGAYTVEAWVQPHDGGDMMIFQHGHGPALFIRDGHVVFRQTETEVVQAGGVPPAAGRWSHVVGTWDGVRTARLYVDGVEVGRSDEATRAPSGTGSTLYLGNGEHVGGRTLRGTLDEVALYAHELSASRIALHQVIGTYVQPSDGFLAPDEFYLDVTRPKIDLHVPTDGAVFNAGKVPAVDWTTTDPDGVLLDGTGWDIVVCVPTLGGGTATVTCTDRGGNVKTVAHGYTVADYPAVVANDEPIGHWRLGDPADSPVMAGEGGAPDGAYRSAPTAGGPGISGDGDATRSFLGKGGYGEVQGLAHPRWSFTVEAWVKLADPGDAMILQHGRGASLRVDDGRVVFRQTTVDVPSTVTAASLVGGFHHVVGTWDGVDARLYVDGVQQGDAAFAPTPPSGSSAFLVGYGDLAPWLRGDLDEIASYPTALPPARVYEHFYADPPPGETPKPAFVAPSPVATGVPVLPPAAAPARPSGASAARPAAPRRSVRVVRRDGRLVAPTGLTARCPRRAQASCAVTATLTRLAGSKAVPAGRVGRRLAPGRAWRVEVPLSSSAVRALRRAGRAEALVVVATQARGERAAPLVARIVLRAP